MLDEIDRGLIHALQIDGRAPFNRIGAVLGVSTQTIARRYRRLCAEAGLRVVGLADPQRAGRAQWLARLTAAPHAAQDLAQALARRADTSWVKLASGGTEIMAVVHTTAGDGNALLLHDIPRTAGITAVSAHYLLHTYVGGPTAWRGRTNTLTPAQQHALLTRTPPADHPRSIPPHQPALHPTAEDPVLEWTPTAADSSVGRPGAMAGNGKPAAGQLRSVVPGELGRGAAEVGVGDRALLEALGRDGRGSLAELAGATGWSAGTVGRRLAELEGSGAIFFDVDVNPAMLGVTTSAMLWMSVAPAHLDAVATSLAEHEELAFVAATTGATNLVAHALTPDPAALHHYLTHRLAAYEAIRTMETAPVLRTVKTAAPFATRPASRSTGVS